MLYCTALDSTRPEAALALAALWRSLRANVPGAELLALTIGDEVVAVPSGVTAVAGNPDLSRWRLHLTTDPSEVAGVLAGPALRAALDRADSATFLSPAIRVHGALTPLADALERYDVALVPLLERSLPEDDLHPDASRFSAWGRFSSSILAMRRSDAADALLSGWPTASNPLPEETVGPTPRTVRQHLNAAAALGTSTVVRDRGVGAAFWNLPLRPPTFSPDGFRVGGEPLLALDLTGLDPFDPHSPWPHQNRLDLTACPEFGIMLLREAQELAAAGDEPEPLTDRLGHEIDPALRLLAAEAIAAGELTDSPWSDTGAEQWEAIVDGPARAGGAAGVTRYQHALWRIREDLREHFPDPGGDDGEALVRWYFTWGPGAAEIEQEQRDLGEPMPLSETLPWGVNVAGYFRSALGLGEAARLVIAGLDTVHVPALPIHGTYVPPTRQSAEFTYTTPAEAPYPINLLCLNGDIVPLFAHEVGRPFFRDRHTIAMWWWEIDNVFPDDWHAAFEYLDEIWVATEHIRRAIEPHSPIPVTVVRMPVDVPEFPPLPRTDLGMPEEGYTFLFIYDYHSTGGRKNPLGLIEAFRSAFRPGEGAKLVLKTINGHRVPRQHLSVLAAAAEHPDIVVIDRFVSADDKNAMVAACDSYVSLHRSEGFGLTLAEAMVLGKPVIATRYGGVLDFMTDENSLLVDHGWSLVGPEAAPYPAEGRWAEPDLEMAAGFMRRLFEDRELGERLGARGRADLQTRHSPEAAGATMAARLREIHDGLTEQATLSGAVGRFDPAPTHHRLTGGLPQPVGRFRRPKRAYGKLLARLTNPVLRQQRAVDHQLLDGLVQLSRQVNAVDDETAGVLRQERAQTLAAMRRLRASELAHDRRLQQVEASLTTLTEHVQELQDTVVNDIQRRSS